MNVEIIRSNRKTLSLMVKSDQKVLIRAPYRTKEEEILRFLAKHETWIERRVAELGQISLDLSDGAKLKLFGNEYRIERGLTALGNNILYLPVHDRMKKLVALLKQYSKQVMTSLTEHVSHTTGLCYSQLKISSARSRWGSCNKTGGLSYSFRIAFLPLDLIEYIVVHELCHTKHFNHSVRFWKEVEWIIPDYRNKRKTLKKYGTYMNLL